MLLVAAGPMLLASSLVTSCEDPGASPDVATVLLTVAGSPSEAELASGGAESSGNVSSRLVVELPSGAVGAELGCSPDVGAEASGPDGAGPGVSVDGEWEGAGVALGDALDAPDSSDDSRARLSLFEPGASSVAQLTSHGRAARHGAAKPRTGNQGRMNGRL